MADCDNTWQECDDLYYDEEVEAEYYEDDEMMMDEEEESAALSPFGLVWGIVPIAQVALGYMVYDKYVSPNQEKVKAFVDTDAASKTAWEDSDQASGWSMLANLSLFPGALGLALWIGNAVAGNNGGPIHMIFVRWSEVNTLLTIAMPILANSAIGNYDDCVSGFDEAADANKPFCIDGTEPSDGADNQDKDASGLSTNVMIGGVVAFLVSAASFMPLMNDLALYGEEMCMDEDGNEIECPEEDAAWEEEMMDEPCYDYYGEVVECEDADEYGADDYGAEDQWWM